jgi:hypothetical protein
MANIFRAKSLISRTGVFSDEVLSPNLIYNTGEQFVSGLKKFDTRPTVNGTGVLLSGEAASLPTTIVYTTGNQSISGNKTFNNTLSVGTISGLSAPYGSPSIHIKGLNNGTDFGGSFVGGYVEVIGGSGNNGGGNVSILGGDYSNQKYGGLINLIGSQVNINNDNTASRPVTFYKTGASSPQQNLSINQNSVDVNNDFKISGVLVTPNSYATIVNLASTGLTLTNNITSLSGLFTGYTGNLDSTFASDIQLFNTGVTLNNRINSLSGVSVLAYGNQNITGNKTFINNLEIQGTGIFNALDLSNISEFNFSGTNINLISGNVNVSGQIYISGNPVLTGVNLSSYATIANLASTGSTLATNLAGTGSTLVSSINSLSGLFTGYTGDLDSTFATDIQLQNTGSTLSQNINSLSGTLTNDYYLKSNPSGFITGVDLSSYLTSSTASSTYATITNLASTGSALVTNLANTGSTLVSSINSFSGLFTGFTGNLDATYATDIQLFNTGSTLDNKINSLSGVSVLTYGNQNISGTKNFIDNVNFSGTGTFNAIDLNNIDNLSLSGVDVTLTDSIINVNRNIFISGNPVLTGVNLTPYATTVNLALTGLNLSNNISSLSGLFTGFTGTLDSTFASDIQLASTGSNLDTKINNLSGVTVLTHGDQTISGTKTFATGVNISGHVGMGIGIDSNNFNLYVRKSRAGVSVSPDSNSIAVFEGSGSSHITVLASDAQSAGVVLGSPADNFGSYLTWNHDNNALKLATAKTSGFIQILTNDENEAVRITRSGDVGIGTISPSEKLQVVGNILANNLVYNTGNQSISGIKTFSDNVYINNLYVTGTETIINTAQINLASNYLLLNLTGGAVDGGIFFVTGSGLTGINDTGPIIGFDHSNKFKFGVSTRNSDHSTLPDIASVQDITAYSGFVGGKYSTIINLASTGSTLSTNLASTGSTLQTNINNLSNTYATITNLASTGSTLVTNLASTGSTLATNLANTGSTLQTNINNLSNTYATITNVGLTGITLNNNITSLSGLFTGFTGNLDTSYATDLQVTNTGITLNTRINNLSGYINSTSSNIVFTTGNQTISGVKTFVQDATFGDTGQGDFLVISGNNFTVYGSGNFTSGLFVNGNAVLTGVNLSSYATTANLASTGSTLQTNINNLSNTYATITNVALTGSTLATNIASTGSTLQTNINNLSSTYATITNLASTGSTLATNLANTGSTLNSNIISLSGLFTGYTGNLDLTFATDLQVLNTGITLNTRINNLSGYINSTNSNILYTTGNQTVTGIKTFRDTILVDQSSVILSGAALNLVTKIVTGSTVTVTQGDYAVTQVIDYIEGDLAITRGVNGGPYNPIVDGSWVGNGPAYTTWNADGWNDLSNIQSRTYVASMQTAMGENFNNIPNYYFVMRDTYNNRYYKLKFNSWQVGAGNEGGYKGFSYTRTLVESISPQINGSNVGGNLNLSNRLFINGTGVLLSGEAGQVPNTIVQTSGAQTISGIKTFNAPTIFNSGTTFNSAATFNNNITVAQTGIFNSMDVYVDEMNISGVNLVLTSGSGIFSFLNINGNYDIYSQIENSKKLAIAYAIAL